MKKLCLLFVALASVSCAAVTPPPRFSEVGPADADAPEAPPPPPLTLPRAEPSPRPAPTPTPHAHQGHHR
jgi:hypothetical protein